MKSGSRRKTPSTVGATLRTLREARRLSMRELASRSDVSVGLISKIEAGGVSPTVMTLQKLVDAMDTNLHGFFGDQSADNPSDQIVFRRSEMAVARDDERSWFYAFPRHSEIKAELSYEEYHPHTRRVEKEKHSRDLMGLVLAGELTLEITGRGKFRAKAGDAFYVKAGQLHVARNDGNRTLKLVAVQIR
jgi:transcriptional regulator with XRE-family HTH domain